jgi:hypothetical protein
MMSPELWARGAAAARLVAAPLLCGALLASCSESTPSGGIGVDEWCPAFAATLCEGYETCCAIPDPQGCIDQVQAECEAGEVSSIRAGFSTLDGMVAEVCLEAYRASFEDCMYDDAIGAACRYIWYGFNGPGEECRDVWYCERGLGCQGDGVEGTCVEFPLEGESCGETGECAPGGLYCSFVDWTCHREPALGETCERAGICAAGGCVDGTCQAVSWCG